MPEKRLTEGMLAQSGEPSDAWMFFMALTNLICDPRGSGQGMPGDVT